VSDITDTEEREMASHNTVDGLRIERWRPEEPPLCAHLSERLQREGLSICNVSLPPGYRDPARTVVSREAIWLVAGWMRVGTGDAADGALLGPGDRVDFARGSRRTFDVVGEDSARFLHGLDLGPPA
jgi:hypothetical protein